MNTPKAIDTYELLNTGADFIHILLHTAFKLTKGVRRKYKLSVNSVLIINACYVYHKYIGTAFSLSSLYKLVGYYNRDKLRWYITDLCSKGYIVQSEVINGNKYYKLSSLGIEVINSFSGSYQTILAKYIEDHHIEL